MVFDKDGEQLSEFQGRLDKVYDKIMVHLEENKIPWKWPVPGNWPTVLPNDWKQYCDFFGQKLSKK